MENRIMRLKFEYDGLIYPFSLCNDTTYEERFVMIPTSDGSYLKARIDNNGEYTLDEIVPNKDVKIIFDYAD